MAAYSSSDESHESGCAPTDFSIATSLDESTYSVNFTSERCPLCRRAKTPQLCGSCVKIGGFFHSKIVVPQESDSFHNKRQRLIQLEDEHKQLAYRKIRLEMMRRLRRIFSSNDEEVNVDKRTITFEEAMCNKIRIIKKRSELLMARETVSHLKYAVSSLSKDLEKDRSRILMEQEINSANAAFYRKYNEKTARICRYIDMTQTYILKHSSILEEKLNEIMALRRELITLLVMHIFPVVQMRPKAESTDSMVMSTVSALAEARRMSYVGGRWVYMDNGSEMKYQIIEPCLPGNGDYSVYNMWKSVKGAISGQELESDVTERSPAHTISAALCFTTQLVNILAAILDVHLPKRLCYGEFCGDDLVEGRFTQLVLKLNQNILTLCASQRVSPESIHPEHTLHNVLQLLQARDLGRSQPYELEVDRMQMSMDDLYFTYSDSDSEQDDDRDWENVPSNLPEVELPSGSYLSQQSAANMYSTDQPMAGGFVSSAAAFGASLWRAATGQSDKR